MDTKTPPVVCVVDLVDLSAQVNGSDIYVCSNFYWVNYERYYISSEELVSTGVIGPEIMVHPDIVDPLMVANRNLFESNGLVLSVKEGFRPPALYHLVYRKKVERDGEKAANAIYNITDMPHASGRVVDVVLFDPNLGQEVWMRDGTYGDQAKFFGFHALAGEVPNEIYHGLQLLMAQTMQGVGFRFGSREEYFHWEYRPDDLPTILS